MNQIVAIVTEKKVSSSMGTLTSTAVRMKSSSMKTRLPAIRIISDILEHKKTNYFIEDELSLGDTRLKMFHWRNPYILALKLSIVAFGTRHTGQPLFWFRFS